MSMNEKTDVQVIINDKRYTISGYESSDYLQHIANYINDKLQSFKKQDAYNHLDMDMKNILLAINLSDDYFKAQKLAEENKQQQGEVEQEMFRMKHEIVSRDEEMKSLKEQLQEAKDKVAELEKKTIRLETEIEQKDQELEQRTGELDKKTKEIDEKNKELQRRAVMQAQPPVRQVYNAPAPSVRTQPVPAGTKPQMVTPSQTTSSSTGTPAGAAPGINQKTTPVVNAAAAAEKPVEDVMLGIQPAKEDKKEEKKPSIAAFEFEEDPKEENAQAGQNGGKGRKNSNSRRSPNKRK